MGAEIFMYVYMKTYMYKYIGTKYKFYLTYAYIDKSLIYTV